jgi:peptidoglycan/LPS O-acetylase OafA/YrhL
VGPALANALLVQAWIPSEGYYFGANGVAWSLSCEAFFYAVAPFLLPRLARLGPDGRRVAMGALVGLVAVVAVAFPFTDYGSGNAWFSYIFPPVRLAEFALGALLAHEVRAGRVPRLRMAAVVPVAVASVVVAGLLPPSYSMAVVTLVPFLALIAAAAQADDRAAPSLLRSAPLVTLGAWSYAFYLLHEQVLREVSRRVAPAPGDTAAAALVLGVALVVSIAASGLLYRLVERPAERWLRSGRALWPVPVPRPKGTAPTGPADAPGPATAGPIAAPAATARVEPLGRSAVDDVADGRSG